MGLFSVLDTKRQLMAQDKTIADLEETVDRLSEELELARAKIDELSRITTASINAQAKLATDMNTIYDSIVSVSNLLQGQPARMGTSAEDYVVWGWTAPDDDLPN